MHYRRLGRSGIKVSEISLGTWVTFGNQISEQAAVDLVHTAYDQGVNFFDTADMYTKGKAERILGKAINGIARETLVISSKVFYPTMEGVNGRGLSRKHIIESIHASLKRLKLDYVDIYYCHRHDPDTTVQEVVQTMDMLVRQGKVLYWGTSQWDTFHLIRAITFAKQNGLIPPMVEQSKYNLMYRERVENEMAPLCREYGIGLTTYSPLNVGILSGKYNDGIPENSRAALEDMAWLQDRMTREAIVQVRQFTEIARELGATTAQLAIAWLLRRKEVSCVISGASRPEQLDENLAAAEFKDALTVDVLDTIENIFGIENRM
ncbi:MAG: aldo/keto reductase [Anaerolineaceae bacterium]|nr:aldo/keto reductase [Anaerolineaceae bacterium]